MLSADIITHIYNYSNGETMELLNTDNKKDIDLVSKSKYWQA